MKVRKNQLKSCIFLTKDELEEIIRNETGRKVIVHIELDGMWYEEQGDEYFEDSYYTEILEKHFEVEINSIHIDDCDVVGIWLVIKTVDSINGKIAILKELVGDILEEAPSVENCSDKEEEFYAEVQNLKEAIEAFNKE